MSEDDRSKLVSLAWENMRAREEARIAFIEERVKVYAMLHLKESGAIEELTRRYCHGENRQEAEESASKYVQATIEAVAFIARETFDRADGVAELYGCRTEEDARRAGHYEGG